MKPILFTINLGIIKIPIHSYGVMIALSFFIGTLLSARWAERREGIDSEEYVSITMWVIVAILIGSRLFFVFEHLEEYSKHPLEIFAVWKGGLVLYGGFFGGVAGGMYLARRRRVSIPRYFDAGAPSIALGIFLTRIGCFLNGCCYGKPTDSPLGVSFPKGSYAYYNHLRNGLISPESNVSLPVHPTELYSSLGGLVLFGIMLFLIRRRKRFDGQYMFEFTILYSVMRFIVEIFRGDHPMWAFSFMTTPQVISSVIFVICVPLYLYLYFRKKEEKDE